MPTIHIIDDDPDILDLARAVLELAGHEVRTFRRAAESLDALTGNRSDAVVLDLMLSEMDGFEYLERLRKKPDCARIPVLVMSALGHPQYRVRAFKWGADDFLVKPVEPEELVVRLERLIERTTAISLQGRIDTYSIPELLQSLEQGRRAGLVQWIGDEGTGWIALVDGVVAGARSGRLRGMEGALSLLDLEAGHFELHPVAPPPEVQERRFPVTDLLMQKSWLEDEIGRRLGWLREAERGIWPGSSESGTDEVENRIVNRVRALPGIELNELIRHQIASPQRTRYLVAILLEKGALRATPPRR